jgi:hypothetical protein
VSNNANPYRNEGNSTETASRTLNGIAMLLLVLVLILAEFAFVLVFRNPILIVGNAVAIIFICAGFFSLQPNEAGVLTLFGDYLGTERKSGLRWTFPWNMRKRVSVRARNHAVDTLKVNDKRGNPVEIGAVVVWRVNDTAQATFDVDDFEQFVHVQSESAVRHVASRYNYDEYEDHEAHELTLRGGADAVAEALREELHARVQLAGRRGRGGEDHAPGVRPGNRRRDAAPPAGRGRHRGAHEDRARRRVDGGDGAEGAVRKGVVDLDDERRAAMVSNLMVVLCSERDTQPIVNTGTLYT